MDLITKTFTRLVKHRLDSEGLNCRSVHVGLNCRLMQVMVHFASVNCPVGLTIIVFLISFSIIYYNVIYLISQINTYKHGRKTIKAISLSLQFWTEIFQSWQESLFLDPPSLLHHVMYAHYSGSIWQRKTWSKSDDTLCLLWNKFHSYHKKS
jgi:hypothetical protein